MRDEEDLFYEKTTGGRLHEEDISSYRKVRFGLHFLFAKAVHREEVRRSFYANSFLLPYIVHSLLRLCVYFTAVVPLLDFSRGFHVEGTNLEFLTSLFSLVSVLVTPFSLVGAMLMSESSQQA